MQNGLTSAPIIFKKLSKPVLCKKECLKLVEETTDLLSKLDFQLILEK